MSARDIDHSGAMPRDPDHGPNGPQWPTRPAPHPAAVEVVRLLREREDDGRPIVWPRDVSPNRAAAIALTRLVAGMINEAAVGAEPAVCSHCGARQGDVLFALDTAPPLCAACALAPEPIPGTPPEWRAAPVQSAADRLTTALANIESLTGALTERTTERDASRANFLVLVDDANALRSGLDAARVERDEARAELARLRAMIDEVVASVRAERKAT